MPAFLVAETGHSMPLPADAVVVGSDPQAHVPIRADLGLAPHHYELRPMPGQGHQVVSLRAQFPVMVNDQPVPSAMLMDGDVITAGGLRLMYRNEALAAPPAPVASSPPPLPTMSMPPPLPARPMGEISPPQLAATMALPRIGSRVPGQLALPENDEDMTGYSEAAKQKKRAEKLMQESLDRTQQRMAELKSEQNFNLAIVAALVALAVGCFGYMYLYRLTWKLWLPATAALGFGVGWIIRLGGKGIDRRFGVLAAITGILCIAAANFVNYDLRMAEYRTSEEELAAAEESEYAQETPEEKADRLAREEQTRREDEQRAALYEAQFQEELGELQKKNPHLFDPEAEADSEEVEVEEEAETATEEENLDEEALAYDEPEPGGFSLFAIFWLLCNPKSLVGYFVIGGAAYRAAFRFLTNEEASNLHLGGQRAEDLSGLSLRERIKLGQAS
ncbi:MAG: hypothetical protein IPK22_28975 [Verrucomicrobiaceae bacterium]|nr:hypothetical protein [Verrucomicrobiaceae bacterium]